MLLNVNGLTTPMKREMVMAKLKKEKITNLIPPRDPFIPVRTWNAKEVWLEEFILQFI